MLNRMKEKQRCFVHVGLHSMTMQIAWFDNPTCLAEWGTLVMPLSRVIPHVKTFRDIPTCLALLERIVMPLPRDTPTWHPHVSVIAREDRNAAPTWRHSHVSRFAKCVSHILMKRNINYISDNYPISIKRIVWPSLWINRYKSKMGIYVLNSLVNDRQ